MIIFLKATAGVLVSIVFCIAISKHGNDFSLLLTIAVCCMVLTAAVSFIEPVINFIQRLQAVGQLNSEMLETLLKAVGTGMLAEVACLICTDAGNASLGKALKLLATSVILCMSVPLFSSLLELVENILVNT